MHEARRAFPHEAVRTRKRSRVADRNTRCVCVFRRCPGRRGSIAVIPPTFFVDRQIRGPYRLWRHEHRFEAVDGGTRVRDRVEYLPPLRWLTSGIVVRDVERIFAYRRHELLRLAASGEIYDPSG